MKHLLLVLAVAWLPISHANAESCLQEDYAGMAKALQAPIEKSLLDFFLKRGITLAANGLNAELQCYEVTDSVSACLITCKGSTDAELSASATALDGTEFEIEFASWFSSIKEWSQEAIVYKGIRSNYRIDAEGNYNPRGNCRAEWDAGHAVDGTVLIVRNVKTGIVIGRLPVPRSASVF